MSVIHGHWIGGRACPPIGGRYLPTIDPSTRRAGECIASGSKADVEFAVNSAREAQNAWAGLSGVERSEALHRIADVIARNADALMETERASTGKIQTQLRLEVDMSAAYFRYYAGVLRSVGGRVIDQGVGVHTYTRLEPYGIVAIITPWNLPLNQACRAVAPALAVGNAVVVKPSEFTSISTLELARLASESGLAPGVFNVVTGTGVEVGSPLASHPDVRRIAFTGSVATGRALAEIAAERLIPMTLELGGKSPLVVFADADLGAAVAAAVNTVAFNAGQVCSATTRLLVERSAHDEVTARVIEGVSRLRPGIDFGPMITQTQYKKVLQCFAQATANGLRPAVGGSGYEEGLHSDGWFVKPTVYVDIDPQEDLFREEIFGPVLVTSSFDDERDSVIRANDTKYGLVASVWSGDVARGIRVAEKIEAGQVAVNGGALTVETPFGGFKQSGYGREKGLEALHEYTQTKTISLFIN